MKNFKVKIWIFCLSRTHRVTVYCFSACECLFSPILLHSGGGRCQPRMVLVMMLPPQCRALTLRLCQLWCVTTAWVTGCSSEGEPEVWGESDASLTLSDQQDELGNQTLKRRDRSPYILIQRIENEGRRRAGSSILSNWWSSYAGPGSVCISTMFAHFCLQMSTELVVVEARRGLQSHTHVHSSWCAGSLFFPPVLAHIGSFSAFRVNAADLSVSLLHMWPMAHYLRLVV